MVLLRRLSYFMLFAFLVGCGGGSLSGDDPVTGGDEAKTITLSISTTDVTGQNPATVSATVKQGSAVVSGEVVTFTSTTGALTPNSGTALTDSTGVATITLTAGTVRGAGTVKALISSGAEASVGFKT